MTIGDHIARRCNNVAKTTKLRIILGECRGTKKETREPTLTIWWEQVMELGEKDGDEGPFLGWDNWIGRRGEHWAAERCETVRPL